MPQPGGREFYKLGASGTWQNLNYYDAATNDWKPLNTVGQGQIEPPPEVAALTYGEYRPAKMGAAFGYSSGQIAFDGRNRIVDFFMKLIRVGGKFVRYEMPWDKVQPTQTSTYNWGAYHGSGNSSFAYSIEERVTIMNALGLEFIPMFCAPPAWAQVQYTAQSGRSGWRPVADAYMDMWGDFILAYCQRFPWTKVIEIWNEPNMPGFWQNQNSGSPYNAEHSRFVAMCANPYNKIREAGLDVVVLPGGLATGVPVGGAEARYYKDFFQAQVAAGLLNVVDGCCIHPYGVELEQEVDNFFTPILIEQGKGSWSATTGRWRGYQVWNTEDAIVSRPRASWGSWIAGANVTDATSVNAAADNRNNALAIAQVERVGRWFRNKSTGPYCYFGMHNRSVTSDVEDNWGMMWDQDEAVYEKPIVDGSGVVVNADKTVSVDPSINKNITEDATFYAGDKGSMRRAITILTRALGAVTNDTL